MASNKRRIRSKVGIIIAAVFLVFWLLSTSRRVGDQPEGVGDKRVKFGDELELPEGVDEKVKFYLRCMNRHKAPRGQYEDPFHHIKDILCRDTGRAIAFSYQAHGRLPPEYVEALQIEYKGNQTQIDIFICQLDFRRCSEKTRELTMRHLDHELLHVRRKHRSDI